METELFGHTPIWVPMGHGPKAKTALQRPLVRAIVVAAPRAADPLNGDRVVVWLSRHLLYYAGPGGLLVRPRALPSGDGKTGAAQHQQYTRFSVPVQTPTPRGDGCRGTAHASQRTPVTRWRQGGAPIATARPARGDPSAPGSCATDHPAGCAASQCHGERR
jgi:hypothetical protein